MSELEGLITRIRRGINEKASYIKTIRYPRLLLLALKELNDMIGNDNLKDAVASDISHLIFSKMTAEQHPEMKEDEVMLNIVLKGDPGVGKTVLATKIGKIFYSLGYLNGGKKENSGVKEKLKDTLGSSSDQDNTGMMLYIFFIFVIIFVTFMSVLWSFYESFGGQWTIALIILVLLILIIVGYLIYATLNNDNNNNFEDKNVNIDNIKNEQDLSPDDMSLNDKLPPDSQIIKITSREDFVAEYVGHTAIKTNKLLNANRGKVIFVDEAYSLYTRQDDIFGIEAATSLNLFMSQNPNEIIVIFAGYQDLLEKGIFSAQPGLKRRFMYHFQCDGYTPEQLFKIFKLQLAKKGWGVDNENEVVQLFIKEKDAFPFNGGDTERLTHYAKVEHSKEFMAKEGNMKLNKLSPENIKQGIIKLKANNGGGNTKSTHNINFGSDLAENFIKNMGRQM